MSNNEIATQKTGQQNTVPTDEQRTKIIVRRTFGEQNLLDLYSDYVANKIKEKLRKTESQPSGS